MTIGHRRTLVLSRTRGGPFISVQHQHCGTDSHPLFLFSELLRLVATDLSLLNYYLNDKHKQKLLWIGMYVLSAKCQHIRTLNKNSLFSLAFGLLYKHTTSFCRIFIIIITIPYFRSTWNDEYKTNPISNQCIYGDQTTNSKAQHGEWKLIAIKTTPSKFWCNIKERLVQLQGSQ